MRFCIIGLAALAVCVCSWTAQAALINGGFETGDFTGWTVGGNAPSGVALTNTLASETDITGNYYKAHTGSYVAYANLGTTDPPTTFSLEQTFPVSPGVKYEWGFSQGVFSTPASFNSHYGITEWLNGGPFIASGSGSIGSGFITFTTGSYVAPASTTSATIKFEWTGNTTGGGVAGFSIDDVFFRPVPEPGTVGVAVVVTMGLLARRRMRSI